MQVPVTLMVDLSPIGGGEVAAAGYIDIDRGGDPSLLVVDFEGISTTPRSAILGILPQAIAQRLVVSGRTTHNETFLVSIELQTSATTSDSGALRATFILAGYSISPHGQPRTVAEWRFPLYNWAVRICDICTASDDNRSFKRDRIQFTVERRTWIVVDHTIANRAATESADHNHPIRTATLIAPALIDDLEDTALEAADVICLLLSFALGRRVNWVAAVGCSAEHQEITSSVSSRIIEPYNLRGLCPIDNFDAGVLRNFIESAYCEVINDVPWFRLTLGYYIGTKSRQFVDVRSMILYMLLDRIADRVLPGNWGPRFTKEIDSLLSASFASTVTAMFAGTIPNWTSTDTDSVLGVVKQWNRSPSYPDKIRAVSAALNLPPPSRALLAQRHRALHTGSYDGRSMDLRETWLKADWLVLSLLLRLLGYSGQVFHPTIGSHPLPLADAVSRLVEIGGIYEP